MFNTTLLPRLMITLSLVSVVVRGADLTGHWLSSMRSPDGQVRETSLFLTVKDTAINGYMLPFNQDPAEITNAKLTGNDLTFTTVRDYYGENRSMNFSGTLADDAIVLHMVFPNGMKRDLNFKRVSSKPPGPMPPATPKVTLPKAETVAYNGLAKTPPMGWNSWNKFQRLVTDKLVRETADAMASNGMKDAGYQYINIDDTWEAGRDAQGNIQTNEKFPDMKALADYVHAKGLKLGISILRPDQRPVPATMAALGMRFKTPTHTPLGESITSNTIGAARNAFMITTP